MKKPSFNKVVATFGIAIIFIIVYAALAKGSLEGAGLTSGLFPAYQSPQQQAPVSPPPIKSPPNPNNLFGYGSPPSTTPSTTQATTPTQSLFNKSLEDGIKRRYIEDGTNVEKYGDFNSPGYKQFHDDYMGQMITNGQVDPYKAAVALLPDPEEARLLKVYEKSHRIIQNEAQIGGENILSSNAEGLSARNAIANEVTKTLNEYSAGLGNAVKPEIDKAIIYGNGRNIIQTAENIIQKHAPRFSDIRKKIGIQ